MRLIFSAVLMCVGFVLIGYSIWTFFYTGSTEHTGFAFFSVCLSNIFFTCETFSQLKKGKKMETSIA
jgi:O-antigen/teichoic acid export membrane protein